MKRRPHTTGIRGVPVARPDEDEQVAFWSLVDMRGLRECWEWKGARSPAGYGTYKGNAREWSAAHRIAYRLAYAQDPGHWSVLHCCDNPPCCNPRHLRLGACVENVADLSVNAYIAHVRFYMSLPVEERDHAMIGDVLAHADGRWHEGPHGKVKAWPRRMSRSGSRRCRVSERGAIEIRRAYFEYGNSIDAIVLAYRVTAPEVHNILTRKTWSHLP